MKVYIVTSGCYSDYHIEKVFTDPEQARLYALLDPDRDGLTLQFSCFRIVINIVLPGQLQNRLMDQGGHQKSNEKYKNNEINVVHIGFDLLLMSV